MTGAPHRVREDALPLLLSLLRSSADGESDQQAILKDNRLLKEVIRVARLNQVAPFLYQRLKNAPGLPADEKEELRALYLRALAGNGINAAEGRRVVGLLKERGIAVMLLKGAVASELLFGDPGLYLAGDIDILVRPDDLTAARDLLSADGYGYDAELEDAWRQAHYHLGFWKGEGFYLEAHWNLAKGYFRVPPEFWWEGAVTEKAGAGEVLLPAPEKYLLYGIFRLFSHDFVPLKFFIFLDGLIGRYGERMDWKQFFSWARRYRMERLAIFSLKVLHDFFGTEVPAEATKSGLPSYTSLKRGVEKGVAAGERAESRKVLYLLLLESPAEVVKAVAGRLFPSSGELRIRYQIRGRGWKVLPWYLFNLFLLPWRVAARGRSS